MVSRDPFTQMTPNELVSSFQVLHLVAEVLSQILSGNDATSITPTISRIHQKFKQCEKTLESLPGGSMTRAEQLEEIERLREDLRRKRDLLDQYAKHDVIARVLTQQPIPEVESEGKSTRTNTDSSAALNLSQPANERARLSTNPHDVTDPDTVMKMDEDFGDISGVPDTLQKDSSDDVLMGLEI